MPSNAASQTGRLVNLPRPDVNQRQHERCEQQVEVQRGELPGLQPQRLVGQHGAEAPQHQVQAAQEQQGGKVSSSTIARKKTLAGSWFHQ